MLGSNRILKDFFSLSFSEFLGKFFGLIAISYLARVISPEGFGIIAFVTALITYFTIFVEFGFDVISVKKISNNPSVINKYVNNVITIKFVNALFLYVILFIVVFLLNRSIEVKICLLLYGLIIFVQAISLEFVFQGTEKFKYLSYKIIGRSLLYLILILIFIRNDNNVYFVFIFMVLSNLIFSIWHFHKYQNNFGVFRFEISKRFLKTMIKESYPLLLSVVMATIYGNMDLVMLGFIKSDKDVGIYNASYKLFLLAILPFNILLRVFLPTLSRFTLSKIFRKDLLFFISLMICLGILITVPLFCFSNELLFIIYGKTYTAGNTSLKILAVNGFIVCLSIAFGNPLTVWGKQKLHAIALTIGAVCNIILNFLLIPSYSYNGAALATLFSELAVFCGLLIIFINSTRYLFTNKLT